ncbi:pro-sigmaK processing inhibitor BofA family protein [Pelotomaculum terephthalicicum JT]|uniref:pro-sigmaK processing inhibitor BofA family protein n=1 Tax=Pelotomaculum TaxID=191373 RepID=UPI0009C93417|nr:MULTISPECIES: pro-sigmaK processing inhibitor BofA family protein [Pelotomaculum]MCG9968734.1 pro-sigmaK processing inhibitor BofA family protein [Pelotomaculum terephthalicicum JT]OPX86636.1 MAG: Sigma-K factor-processing regulatory protein BofA [Pelotomaculum sp. PtaB.Bin117]OPY59554.1 MAG: Sigma-K factor-processing regulatory protein BofA [Pelotomaculum sp. PtaU1.Bin065]
MEEKFVFIGLAGLLGLYLIGTAMFRPLRLLVRLAAYMLLGGGLLIAINAVFGHLGLHIAVNPVTLLTAGILQLPGVALLVLIHYFII